MIKYLHSRRYFIYFAFVFFTLALIPLVAHVSVDLFFRPQIMERNAKLYQNLPKILSDLEMLDQNPIFPELRTHNNAEFLISKYVIFDGYERNISRNNQYDAMSKIHVDYGNWRNNTLTLEKIQADESLMTLDTSWLEELHAYDHWNFSSNKRVKESMALVPNVNSMARTEIFTQLPVPKYDMMRSWALIHFLQMQKSGHGSQGIKTYRKVTELINTTGTLIGNITAANMLKDEYVLVSKFDIKNWTTRPYYHIDTYIRVSWAWVGLLRLPMFDRLPKKFLRFVKPQNGVCASSWETLATYSIYLDFFQPRTYFESDFSKNVKFTTDLYRDVQAQCNLESYSPFLKRSPASLSPMTNSYNIDASIYNLHTNTDYNYSVEDNWVYLPYLRRLVGLVTFANADPIDYVTPYRNKKGRFAGINFKMIY